MSKSFFDSLQKSYGIKGTIFQKVYFVNTYLFSKIWFLAQCFKLDRKVLENILSKALNFIYAGENERPVRPLNYRESHMGGLGLLNPIIKARALLIKNMFREFNELKDSFQEIERLNHLYGYKEDFISMQKDGVDFKSSKHIYDYLLADIVLKNNSVIPSRSEKRVRSVRWSVAWKNWKGLRGLTAEECEFAWRLQQDLLPIGSRMHRPNADRRCKMELPGNMMCQEIQTRQHLFIECDSVKPIFEACRFVIKDIVQEEVTEQDILYLSFNHRDRRKLLTGLWFAVKMLYMMYLDRVRNKMQILRDMIKELDWNLKFGKYRSKIDYFVIKLCIERYKTQMAWHL